MQTSKLKLPQNEWGSLNTKYPASSIFISPDEFTNGSKNWRTDEKGVITKRPGTVSFQTFTGTPKDQYEAIFSDGAHHLLIVANGVLKFSSGSTFSDVTSGYSAGANFEFANYLDRVYFGNGVDSSQVYDRTTNYGGVAYTAPKTKVHGAQAPSSALTATDDGAGNIAAGTYTYKVTFLYYDFEESNGGTTSSSVTTAGSTQVDLTAIPVGGYGVTARKIYRAISTSPTVFRLVLTISNNTATTGTDNTATGTTLIPEDNGVPPKYKYIVVHQDRTFIAGIDGAPFEVQYSSAGLPDIFPVDNFLTANSQDYITGLVVYNNRVIVFNRNSFGPILGNSPDTYVYSQVPGNIGCVDNRTIQIRTINGVPILIWLSDKGFYSYNGSTVEYLSDPIEPDVNLNIQQASQVTGQNVQTSQSDFQAGTSTPSIDLTTTTGVITQATPTKTWDQQAEWEETNASLTNIKSRDGSNTIKVPTRLAPIYATDGTHNNTIESSGSLTITTTADFTGEDNLASGGAAVTALATNVKHISGRILPTRTGTLTSLQFGFSINSTGTIFAKLYNDNGGVPGTVIAAHTLTFSVAGQYNLSVTGLSHALTANTTYWIGLSVSSSNTLCFITGISEFPGGGSDSTLAKVSLDNVGTGAPTTWSSIQNTNTPATFIGRLGKYVFSTTPVSQSGQWISQNLDTASLSATPATIEHTGSFPTTFGATTSSITYVEGSTDGTTFDVSQAFNNLNGSSAVSLANRRYWRIRIALSTTDDRTAPTTGAAILKFSTTGTWISAPIDHTIDITALNSLTMSSTTPVGTTATVTIATSADDITYSSFTAVGSATPLRYSKVRVVMTTTAANETSPTVTSVTLNWTVVGQHTSSAIDTAVTPAGWDIFSTTFANTVTYHIRSAATSGGLAAASYVAVTNGSFPAITPLQFVQWRATLTSTASSVASVQSVTVRWFVSTTASIRAASIFYNKSYYVSVAEFGQTTNNIIFVLDQNAKWRVYRGIDAATFSFFFNEPYFGSATEGRLLKFLSGTTDNGTTIDFAILTKAFDYDSAENRKVLGKVFVTGLGTGATYTITYSTNGGSTFKSLVNSEGSTTFTTPNDSKPFVERLVPQSADDYQGSTILVKIVTSDLFAVELHEIHVKAFIRKGELV